MKKSLFHTVPALLWAAGALSCGALADGGGGGAPFSGLSISVILVLVAAVLVLVALLLDRGRAVRRERRLLYFDELTGLHNRRGFEKEAAALLRTVPMGRHCYLVALDVNYFKMYNALYGFAAGDELLCCIGRLLTRYVPAGRGVCARMNSDRFAALQTMDSADDFYESLKRFQSELQAQTGNESLLVSYGIYPITDRTLPVASMYDRAVEAKDNVKGSYIQNMAVYDQDLFDREVENTAMVRQLDEALAHGQFVPYYQPKYDARSEQPAGAEARARWLRPDGQVYPPGRFVDVLEKNGLIRRVDWSIFRQTCAMLADRQARGLPVVPVSVNFSRSHLYDKTFVSRLRAVTEEYGVSPALLEVELTESAFIEHAELLIRAMNELHENGFRVDIDDFGSGFSSLNLLKEIPTDVLKIDLRFMEGFESGGKAGTIVVSILRMARWLGLTVVAEGVETAEQAVFLRTAGCDLIQGYYYARPMPEADFLALLDAPGAPAPGIASAPHPRPAYEDRLDDVNALMGGNRLVTALMESVFNAVGLYELVGGRLEAMRVNDGYYRLLGYANAKDFAIDSVDVLRCLPEGDLAAALDALRRARETDAAVVLPLRRRHRDGRLRPLQATCRCLGGRDERWLYFIALEDMSDRPLPLPDMLEDAGGPLATVLSRIPRGVGVFELEGGQVRVKYLSRQVLALFGVPEADDARVRADGVKLKYAPTPEDYSVPPEQAALTGEVTQAVTLAYREGGERFYLRTSARFFREQGRLFCYAMLEDATADIMAERERTWSNERYRILAEAVGIVTFDYDPETDLLIRYLPGHTGEPLRALQTEGFSAALPLMPGVPPESLRLLTRRLEPLLRAPGSETLELQLDFGEGLRWMRLYCFSLADSAGWVYKLAGRIDDIQRERDLAHDVDALRRSASTDPLTGILNRGAAQARIRERLAAGGRCVLMIVDIDNFKGVNDSLGHQAGDAFLRALSQALGNLFRESDVLGRFGGDEFLIFMDGAGHKEGEERARRVLEAVAQIYIPDAGPAHCSLGMACAEAGEGLDYDELFRRADAALYAAKGAGKGAYAVFDPASMDTQFSKTRTLLPRPQAGAQKSFDNGQDM